MHTRARIVLFLISVSTLSVILLRCGGSTHSKSDSSQAQGEKLSIPVSLYQQNTTGLALDENSNGLDLLAVTSVNLQVTGCASGNNYGPIKSNFANLIVGDANCLVKLTSFVVGSTTYQPTGSNAVPFTTWLATNTAVFQGASSSDLLYLTVRTQVTGSGVLSTDTVSYSYATGASGTTNSLSQLNVTTAVPLTASGQAAPNFTIYQARQLTTNADGSLNVSFTLQCGTSLTGSSNATYACSGDLLNTQLDYIFIKDAYSLGTITVAQALAAFAANTPTTVNSLIVAPGGSDLNGNTLTNGGLYTSNASPLTSVSGSAVYPNNLNYVFMLRRKDTSGNIESFLYFYVRFPTFNGVYATYACGTYFAGGAGTSGNPYQVADPATLANTAACTSSSTYFVQTANINLGGAGAPWAPIALYGEYNGSGYTISNMYMSSSAANIGLFSTINSGASVSNLSLSGTVLGSGNISAGLLAGTSNGSVTSVSSSGNVTLSSVSSTAYWGGLIGTVSAGTVSSSSSSATVNFTAASTSGLAAEGGLVGFLTAGSTITSSSATGTIKTDTGTTSLANFYMGGLVGYTATGANNTINNSYVTSTQTLSFNGGASTNSAIGGIVGGTRTLSSTGCYAAPTITSNGSAEFALNIGGFGGYLNAANSGAGITNAYTMGSITVTGTVSSSNIGGFAGSNNTTTIPISLSYSALSSISATGSRGFIGTGGNIASSYLYQNASVPSDPSSGLTTYTTATQMQTQSNFSSFTFGTASSNNWRMPSANPLSPAGLLSPVQNWQCGANGITCI